LSLLIIYVSTSHGLAGRYQRFGGTYCRHFQGLRQYVPPKRWYLPTSPCDVATRKKITDNFTTQRCFVPFEVKIYIFKYYLKSVMLQSDTTVKLNACTGSPKPLSFYVAIKRKKIFVLSPQEKSRPSSFQCCVISPL
jgi:hypothetical protein